MTDLSAVEAVFSAALGLTDPARRAAYLDRACRGDPGLRADVERLLAARADLGGFLEPAGPPADAPTAAYDPGGSGPADAPGTVLAGRYKLLEVVGEGGMGSVWMAQQTEPVRRLVAVKLIKAGMDSRQVLARFEAERQALALMDHPNIAKVLDGGLTPDGRPFFVMELVKGVPITAFCDARALTPRQRLGLFGPVCRAVQHAHQKGVIHRDLKPANVLVALYDDKPVPKVIDFGIAKAAGQPLTEQTLVTGFGAVVGTPEYMSPEQATLNQLDVDTRTDVYSLGVLLYELLAGSPPLPRGELARAGLLEVLRAVREVEPPRPSTRLSTSAGLARLAADRGTKPKELAGLVRGELDWVVMKALEKDRGRRYETAAAFAADVERYLAGDAVAAAPPSAAYRLRKVARRNKAALVAAAVVAGALVAGTAASTWQAVRATRAEGEASAALADARRQRGQARQAVDDMYTQVAQKWLSDQGSLTEIQREFLEKALAFYEGFAEEEGSDPEALYAGVQALDRVGHIQYRLRRYPAAEAASLRLVERGADLARRHPDRVEFRIAAAGGRAFLGRVYRDTARKAEADREAVRGYEELRAVRAAPPGDPMHRRRLAAALENLGSELTYAERLAEADAAVRAAVEIREALAAEFPNDFENLRGLAGSHRRQGMQRMWWGGRNEEAEWSLRQADARLTALLKERPGDVLSRRLLSETLTNLGVILGWTKHHAEEEAVERRALAIREGLAAEFPNDPEEQEALATTLHNLSATIPKTQDRSHEAEGLARRAAEIRERLADRHPDVLGYKEKSLDEARALANLLLLTGKPEESRQVLERSVLRAREYLKARPGYDVFEIRLFDTAILLALAQVEFGDHARAARALEDLLPRRAAPGERRRPLDGGGSAILTFQAGRLLLACADLAGRDAALSPAERGTAVRTYKTRADLFLGDAARAADAWARTMLPNSQNFASNVVEASEMIIDEALPPHSSPPRREIAVATRHLMVKALIREGIRRSPDDGTRYPIADLLSTAPEGLRDPELALTLARRAVELRPADPMCSQALGWALYRAGDWKGCVETIAKFTDTKLCEFILAMAHWRLGDREAARALYRRGDDRLKGYEKRFEDRRRKEDMWTHPPPSMLRRLRAEAAALLGVGPPEPAPPPRPVAPKDP